MAKRPVFLRYLDQVDHDIIRPSLQPLLKIIDDTFVESLLEFDGATGIQRDLNEDDIFAVAAAQVAFSKIQVISIVLRDDLEFVVAGHIDKVDHGLVYDLAQRLSILGGFASFEIDANEWHGHAPFSVMWV